MPAIRLIAIDLDGTLLTDEKRITPATIDMIRRASEAGVKIVLASARPPRSMRAFYQQLQLKTLQINYNGALIWDEPTGQVIFHQPMAGELVLQIVHHCRQTSADVCVQIEILDRWHTDRAQQRFTTETGKLFSPDVIGELHHICRQPVTKLNLLAEPTMTTTIEAMLQREFAGRATIARATEPELLLINHPAVDKGVALQHVAQHYGVQMNQVLAIGDAANDLTMLQTAGVSVAMGNATDQVKSASDWIAPCNNEEGVAKALTRYLPGLAI